MGKGWGFVTLYWKYSLAFVELFSAFWISKVILTITVAFLTEVTEIFESNFWVQSVLILNKWLPIKNLGKENKGESWLSFLSVLTIYFLFDGLNSRWSVDYLRFAYFCGLFKGLVIHLKVSCFFLIKGISIFWLKPTLDMIVSNLPFVIK